MPGSCAQALYDRGRPAARYLAIPFVAMLITTSLSAVFCRSPALTIVTLAAVTVTKSAVYVTVGRVTSNDKSATRTLSRIHHGFPCMPAHHALHTCVVRGWRARTRDAGGHGATSALGRRRARLRRTRGAEQVSLVAGSAGRVPLISSRAPAGCRWRQLKRAQCAAGMHDPEHVRAGGSAGGRRKSWYECNSQACAALLRWVQFMGLARQCIG